MQQFDKSPRAAGPDLPTIVLAMLIAAAMVQIAIHVPGLPDRIPDKPGLPELGMSSKWFATIVLLLPIALFASVSIWAPALLRNKRAIRIPDADYWLAPERRDVTLASLVQGIRWLMNLIIGLILLIAEGGYLLQNNPGGPGNLLIFAALPVLVVAGPGFAIWMARHFSRRHA